MAKVEKKSFEPHPLGWFLFCLGEPEEVESEWDGKRSLRYAWPCESTERMESGDRHILKLFTGRAATTHPADKHRQLVEDGFGIKYDDYEDTDQIVGQVFAGKVTEDEKTKRRSITQFDTRDRVKPAGKAKKSVDPFENE